MAVTSVLQKQHSVILVLAESGLQISDEKDVPVNAPSALLTTPDIR